MLAKRNLDKKFIHWNKKWHAPYGRKLTRRLLPYKYSTGLPLRRLNGMFSLQPNSDTRVYEYPWAYYATRLDAGMKVLDIGGGLSGFPFVLSKEGMHVVNVDPFYDYGPLKHYKYDPYDVIDKMNGSFGTHVQLKRTTLSEARLEANSFDRVFSISAIEHIPMDEVERIMKEIHRILKPQGMVVLTVDLFLNLYPFSKRMENEYGRNISIKSMIDMSGLELITGDKRELFGYEEFDSQEILANLETYFISTTYPVLAQTLVLKKA